MTEHNLILTGPYPYFSTAEVFFSQCTCGRWSGGKDSERNLRRRQAEHATQMEKNERDAAPSPVKGTWD